MTLADNYFEKKDTDKAWYFKDYVVFEEKKTIENINVPEETEYLRFENN